MPRRTQAEAPTRGLLGALAIAVDFRANPELSDLYAAIEPDWAITNVTLPYEHVAHYLRQGAPRRFDREHPRWALIELLHGRPLPEAERRHIVEHTSDPVVIMTVLETQAVTAAERDDALTQHLRRLNATDAAGIVRCRRLEIQESEHLESVLRLCLYGRARGRWNQLDAHRVGERALLRYPADRVSGLVYERLTSNGLCPDRSKHLLDYVVSRHPKHAEWIIEQGWPRQLAALARSRHVGDLDRQRRILAAAIQRFHTAESPIWEGEITIIGSLLLNPQVKMELLESFRDQLAAQARHREWGPTEWFYQHRCEQLTSLVEDRIAVYGKAEPEKALLSASPEMIFHDEIPAALHHISRALSGVNLFEWHLVDPPNEHADAMRTHAVENLEALSHNPALAPEHRTQIRRLRAKAARWTSSPARILGLHPEATPAAVAEPDPSESVGGGSDLAPTRARCHDLARSGVEYWRIVPTSEVIAAIGEELYIAPDVAGYLAEIAIRLGENAKCARTLAAIADEDTQLPLGALVDTARAIVGESDPAPA